MNATRLVALMLLLATPAVAQPIIIPLGQQPKQVVPPVASAPPVAPPIAGPTESEPALARGEPGPRNSAPQEEAYQPPEKQK